jgi:hypothetical protein
VIIAAYAVRPLIGSGGGGFIAFSAAMMALLLIAVYNINVDELIGEHEHLVKQNQRRRIIGWTLVTAAFAERLALTFYARNGAVALFGSIGWLLLLSFVTWSTLRGLLKQKAVTSETISMSTRFTC